MILKDFLSFITDEEARIELEIDLDDANIYESFWLSDYRDGYDKQYDDYEVIGFRFITEFSESDITIEIKK